MLDPKNVRAGEEQYEQFVSRDKRRRRRYVQYDYRDVDGKLFSTIKPTLDECRQARDEWLGDKSQTN